MSLGTSSLGSLVLAGAGVSSSGELIAPDIPPPPDPAASPFRVEITGDVFDPVITSLNIDIESGRQGTAEFACLNVVRVPQVGEAVRILWYSDVLFAGSIDSVDIQPERSERRTVYVFECTDNSYLLFRRKIQHTFTDQTVSQIATVMINSYLANDGISLGTVDSMPTIPQAVADNVSVYEFLSDIAASVGTMFYIDNQKKLNFINSSMEDSPLVINDANCQSYSTKFDRETYRNRQTVIVTGTPPLSSIDPLTISFTTTNSDSATRQSTIEQSSGIYNDIESIVHPTENTTIPLTRLAIAFARIRLGITGSIRQTLKVDTRQYGFRPGQLVNVDLTHLGLTGRWIIQRMSLREEDGLNILTTLELTNSTIVRRAQEMWLEVVRRGKVSIVPPSAIVSNLQTYSTPGTYVFTTPADTYVLQLTCTAPGGGGGGGSIHQYFFRATRFNSGGPGGNGGLAIGVITTSPGEQFTVVVGSPGTGGTSSSVVNSTSNAVGGNGTNGGNCSVSRVGGTICLAYGGKGGIGARSNSVTGLSATYPKGDDGGGLFANVVTVGGGASGGGAGNGSPLQNGQIGQNGKVTIEW